MELETFLKVFFICLLGAMSPGPSWALIFNNTIFKGKIHGYITSIGHGVGITIYALIANLSIGLIIKTNPFFFKTIKIFSIFFLIYIGFRSIFSKTIKFDEKILSRKLMSFLEGFGLAILNPKILIWFISIYSQFMSPNNELIFNIILIITAGIIDMTWYCLLVTAISTGSFLILIKNKIVMFQKFTGSILILLGINLLMGMFI